LGRRPKTQNHRLKACATQGLFRTPIFRYKDRFEVLWSCGDRKKGFKRDEQS
jgi:hypothetical protein